MNNVETLKDTKPPKYIFPNFLAKAMAKVDLRTQYEASMMSMSLISVGLIITMVYLFLYVQVPTWYKIVLLINCFAGLIFLSSFVVTTYQQYKTYMEVQNFQNNVKGGKKWWKKNKKKKEKKIIKD